MTALIHVMGALSGQGAGVSRAVWEMSASLAAAAPSSYEVHLAGILDHGWNGTPPIKIPENLKVHPFRTIGPTPPAFSLELESVLTAASSSPSIIHSHGIWLHPNWKAVSFARRHGQPLIISPHGMLCPWSFGHSRWKKRPIFHLIERHNLAKATCLLASSKQEANDICQFQFGNPVATVPFGLDLQEFPDPRLHHPEIEASWELFQSEYPKLRGQRLILFLGRIHPVEVPEHLLLAFDMALGSKKEFHLVYAGPDDSSTKGSLAGLAAARTLQDRVTFTGPVSGARRLALLRKSNALVLCSHNENFGYVVPESLASGTPVIVSDRTPWGDVVGRECGWSYPHGEAGLASALTTLSSRTPEELVAMGTSGRAWIEQEFAWSEVVKKLLYMYRWALDGGPPPDFVEMPAV